MSFDCLLLYHNGIHELVYSKILGNKKKGYYETLVLFFIDKLDNKEKYTGKINQICFIDGLYISVYKTRTNILFILFTKYKKTDSDTKLLEKAHFSYLNLIRDPFYETGDVIERKKQILFEEGFLNKQNKT